MFDNDGYLTIKGRLNDVINRGGENIYPDEVADQLCQINDISNAIVFGIANQKYGEEVVAAVEWQNSEPFDQEKVNTKLKEKLSKYKIPVYYAVFKNFPLLLNSKIDVVELKKIVTEKYLKEKNQ